MKAYRKVKLIFTGRAEKVSKPILDPKTAVSNIRKTIGKEPIEVFVALLLDGRHCVIGLHEVSRGTAVSSLVHPRELFREAIHAQAIAIIIAHNHPSGNAEPSREDMEVTERMTKAGDIVGVRVIDHLVIGTGNFVSIRDRNPALFK